MTIWCVEVKNGKRKPWRPTNFGYTEDEAEALRKELIERIGRKPEEVQVREYEPVFTAPAGR